MLGILGQSLKQYGVDVSQLFGWVGIHVGLLEMQRHAHNINPPIAKLFNWNFHPLEDVSCWRDPQLQLSENYSDFIFYLKLRLTVFKSNW